MSVALFHIDSRHRNTSKTLIAFELFFYIPPFSGQYFSFFRPNLIIKLGPADQFDYVDDAELYWQICKI